MIATPGDRRDADIVELGRAAAPHFDHVVIPSLISLRGREPGEMPALVMAGIEEAVHEGDKPPTTEVAGDEPEAVRAALSAAVPGDLVVVCAENVPMVWDLVNHPVTR
jgi:cyanophycin synthetase